MQILGNAIIVTMHLANNNYLVCILWLFMLWVLLVKTKLSIEFLRAVANYKNNYFLLFSTRLDCETFKMASNKKIAWFYFKNRSYSDAFVCFLMIILQIANNKSLLSKW